MNAITDRQLALRQTIPYVAVESLAINIPQFIFNASNFSVGIGDKEFDVKTISQVVVLATIVWSAATRIISIATMPSDFLMSESDLRQLYQKHRLGQAAPLQELKVHGAKTHCDRVNSVANKIVSIALIAMTVLMFVFVLSHKFLDNEISVQLQATSVGIFLGIQFSWIGLVSSTLAMNLYSRILQQ